MTPQEEIFFYRLIVSCDDYGVVDARASILRAKCFPLKLDTISEDDIEKWLHKLESVDLIFMYTVDDKRYLKMTSWDKHQQIRAHKSKYPLPDSKGAILISSDINGYQLIADVTVIQSNPIRIQSESNPNPTPAADENVKKIVQLFKNCSMGEINGIISESINDMADNYPMELVKEAFRLAGLINAKSIKYPEKILLSWKAKGITTLEGAKAEQKEQPEAKDKGLNKKLDFNKFPQHEYSEGQLEGLFEKIGE